MPDEKKEEQEHSEEFERFNEGMKRLFAIPKEDARKVVEEAKKVEKKEKRDGKRDKRE